MINSRKRINRKVTVKRPNKSEVTKLTVRQMIKSAVAQDIPLKSTDFNGTISPTTGGTLFSISLPTTQGTANGTRTGDDIALVKLELSSTLYYGDALGNVSRIIVFQVVGYAAGISVGSVLSNGSSAAPDVNSHYVPFAEGKGFKILYDRKHITIPDGNNAIVNVNANIIPRTKKISFPPGTAFPNTGQLAVIVISDSGVVPNPVWNYCFRLYYRDV
jgi:hypothetical protein